jgi:hypothetical protein
MSKPYAFINERITTYATLREEAAMSNRAGQKFDQLNIHILNSVVLPGQLVIVGDDSTQSCTSEEAELMRNATQVREAMIGRSPQGNEFMLRNFDLVKSMLSYGSIGIGSASGGWKLHMDTIKDTLERIERLHRDYLASRSDAARRLFISGRQILFKKLDAQLAGIAKYGTGLQHARSIKKMLGISTKSYLHTGEIAGYAQKVAKISRMSGHLAKGTYVGIALDVSATALAIVEACSMGREDECRKAKFVETVKLAGGVTGALAGGTYGLRLGLKVCRLPLNNPLTGAATVACGIIGGAIGAYALGTGVAGAGGYAGELVYTAVDQP